MTYRNEEPTTYPTATQQQCPECHRELRADCCDVEVVRRELHAADVPSEVERVVLGAVRLAQQMRPRNCSSSDFDRGFQAAMLAIVAAVLSDAGIGHSEAMLRRMHMRERVSR